ncbi:MAG: 23S rRNA (adenine(2503)-C(2))-methyltransferase RlmN, partial [Alphaproteobacteria bacterium]
MTDPTTNLAPPAADGRRSLAGLSRAELAAEIVALDEKPFRAKQLWHWIYFRGAVDFAEMTTLAKPFRAKLAEHFTVGRPEVAEAQISTDGTRKWLLRFADGNEAESVFIPEDDRGALCLSSQVGCTLACSFCRTGTQARVRDLTAAEIVGQVLVARDAIGEWPASASDALGAPDGPGRRLSNIVMMGMGEPLLNFDNVEKALRIVMDGEGIAISKRRITLSTAGVVPIMRRCGEELDVNLAVSLHAVTDDLRDELVPLNRRWPIA